MIMKNTTQVFCEQRSVIATLRLHLDDSQLPTQLTWITGVPIFPDVKS